MYLNHLPQSFQHFTLTSSGVVSILIKAILRNTTIAKTHKICSKRFFSVLVCS